MEIAYHYVVGCELKFVFASDPFKGSLLSKRNPLYTSGIGTGELIRSALRVKE